MEALAKPVKKRSKKKMVAANLGKKRSLLITEADLWASRAVRLIGMEADGLVTCYTCGKKFYPKNIQCGHFVGRAHFTVRYDLRNMRPQCLKCNTYRSGEPGAYALKLLREMGADEMMAMLELGTDNSLPTDEKLAEIAMYYKDLTTKLLEERNAHPWW